MSTVYILQGHADQHVSTGHAYVSPNLYPGIWNLSRGLDTLPCGHLLLGVLSRSFQTAARTMSSLAGVHGLYERVLAGCHTLHDLRHKVSRSRAATLLRQLGAPPVNERWVRRCSVAAHTRRGFALRAEIRSRVVNSSQLTST